jgi:hypothetical protein
MRSNSIDHGGRRHHTAAMGPRSRQQSTQQSTNIICDGSTSLKLEKKYLLLIIWLLMHVASIAMCDNDNTVMGNWAPCCPLEVIANSNGTLPLPTILSTRAGGGSEGGRGLRMSYLSATKGTHRDSGFFLWNDVRTLTHHNSSKKYGTPHMLRSI